ncbi:MAG TPA: hypothetical protein VNJ54_05100 [Plantibacter sp.]|uniref:hypothetical protein n=1 Tax=unclassified Plantibacter TaxID=2624265 RepID=UPI002C909E65|nr:hypothetical protein [Plantibacter sp.]
MYQHEEVYEWRNMRFTSLATSACAAIALSVVLCASPAIASPAENASPEAGTPASMGALAGQAEFIAGQVTAQGGEADPTPGLRKPCNYMHGSRCVTWVTDYYSCKNIFQITNETRKHAACAVFITQGIVTVWP